MVFSFRAWITEPRTHRPRSHQAGTPQGECPSLQVQRDLPLQFKLLRSKTCPHWKRRAVFCQLLEEAKLGGSWRWALGGPLRPGQPRVGVVKEMCVRAGGSLPPRGAPSASWAVRRGWHTSGAQWGYLPSLRWPGTGTTVCGLPCQQLFQQLGCSAHVTSAPEWGSRSGLAENTVPPSTGV